jgi:ABC-type uncharacterized transport system permease subunit
VVAPLAGALFFAAIFVLTASLSFWWVESGEIGSAFTYGGRDFTSYPVGVYGGWFRSLFAYGLGFGFVAYQPALALLGRTDPLGSARLGGLCLAARRPARGRGCRGGVEQRHPPLPQHRVVTDCTAAKQGPEGHD